VIWPFSDLEDPTGLTSNGDNKQQTKQGRSR